MSLRVLKKGKNVAIFIQIDIIFFFLGNRRTADNLATNAHDPGYGACDVDLKFAKSGDRSCQRTALSSLFKCVHTT